MCLDPHRKRFLASKGLLSPAFLERFCWEQRGSPGIGAETRGAMGWLG